VKARQREDIEQSMSLVSQSASAVHAALNPAGGKVDQTELANALAVYRGMLGTARDVLRNVMRGL